MNVYVLLLGIFAIISALISFVLTYVDLKDKRRKIFNFKAIDIKRYLAFVTLFLTMLTIMFEIKAKVDENIAAIDAQTEVLNNLGKIISNTDPISQSTIYLDWTSTDSTSYNSLKESFKNYPEEKILHKNGYYES